MWRVFPLLLFRFQSDSWTYFNWDILSPKMSVFQHFETRRVNIFHTKLNCHSVSHPRVLFFGSQLCLLVISRQLILLITVSLIMEKAYIKCVLSKLLMTIAFWWLAWLNDFIIILYSQRITLYAPDDSTSHPIFIYLCHMSLSYIDILTWSICTSRISFNSDLWNVCHISLF